jgi:hypothetical protein
MKKVICLDFDGVCNTYIGWRGADELFTPRDGLEWFIRQLLDRGKRVAIYSTRSAFDVRSWMTRNFPNFWPDIECEDLFFPEHKPPANVYLDDRGITFLGTFNDELVSQVINFKTFWETKQKQGEIQPNEGKELKDERTTTS